MKTGNTARSNLRTRPQTPASMEPGHEDREYWKNYFFHHHEIISPQWSPVMKTGNTRDCRRPED